MNGTGLVCHWGRETFWTEPLMRPFWGPRPFNGPNETGLRKQVVTNVYDNCEITDANVGVVGME